MGKSSKYLEIKAKFDLKYKEAAEKYVQKHVSDMMTNDPGKAYTTIKKLGAKPGDNLDNSEFKIMDHLEKNLTDHQSVERIAEHFSRISQEYPPLEVTNLSESVRKKLKK